MERLVEASAAEAEAANAVWQAAQAQAANVERLLADDDSKPADSNSEGSNEEGDVRLHPRALRDDLMTMLIAGHETTAASTTRVSSRD
ncbi:putative cytochrome P450 superfamily [Helianthus annuus]|nr:putative cytochrome P450 superfamily [Helianthus annuus]